VIGTSPEAWFQGILRVRNRHLRVGTVTDDTTNSAQGHGLLDFNKLHHVSPSFILNASAGYAFAFGGVIVRPRSTSRMCSTNSTC